MIWRVDRTQKEGDQKQNLTFTNYTLGSILHKMVKYHKMIKVKFIPEQNILQNINDMGHFIVCSKNKKEEECEYCSSSDLQFEDDVIKS